MALSPRLMLASMLATTIAYLNAAGSERFCEYSITSPFSQQPILLQENEHNSPILADTIRPERIVHERVWSLDSAIPAVCLIEVCDESLEFMAPSLPEGTASPADVVAALTASSPNRPVLNDPHFNSIIDADIVTLATDEQSLFDLDLTHGLVVPIQDLSTRTLRFGFHLSLQRAF